MLKQAEEPARRELGDQERYLHNMHMAGALIPVSVLELEGNVTDEMVRKGLDWLQGRHPLLRAHLEYEGWAAIPQFPWIYRRPWFSTEDTNRIPLKVVELADRAALQELVQQELRTRINPGPDPRMRVTLARLTPEPGRHWLVMTADHTIADAQAACRGMRELLSYMADPSPYARDAQRYGLPPTLESRMPPKPDSGAPYEPAIRLPVEKDRRGPRETHTVAASLPVDATRALKAHMRTQRTTMHGLITAMTLKALAGRYAMDDFTCLSNVEFRKVCRPPIPDDTYGCYIDILRTRHRTDKPVDELAREVTFSLVRTLARDQESASLLKMPGREIYSREWRGAMATGMRLDALAVTTAGDSGFARDYGQFRLASHDLYMSLHILGASLFMVSLEIEGSLHLQICYTHPQLSRDDAQGLIGEVAAGLEELAAAEIAA